MKKLFVSMVVLAALVAGCGKKPETKPAPAAAPAAGEAAAPAAAPAADAPK